MRWLLVTLLIAELLCKTLGLLEGDHICPEQESYVLNITRSVLKKLKVRKYRWCFNVPPRCSYYEDEERYVPTTEEQEVLRTINKCCKGYHPDEDDEKCIPDCPDCVHGQCNEYNLCDCHSGYWGQLCDKKCIQTRWGKNCESECFCVNGHCDPVSGYCRCRPGWKGNRCEIRVVTSYPRPSFNDSSIVTTPILVKNGGLGTASYNPEDLRSRTHFTPPYTNDSSVTPSPKFRKNGVFFTSYNKDDPRASGHFTHSSYNNPSMTISPILTNNGVYGTALNNEDFTRPYSSNDPSVTSPIIIRNGQFEPSYNNEGPRINTHFTRPYDATATTSPFKNTGSYSNEDRLTRAHFTLPYNNDGLITRSPIIIRNRQFEPSYKENTRTTANFTNNPLITRSPIIIGNGLFEPSYNDNTRATANFTSNPLITRSPIIIRNGQFEPSYNENTRTRASFTSNPTNRASPKLTSHRAYNNEDTRFTLPFTDDPSITSSPILHENKESDFLYNNVDSRTTRYTHPYISNDPLNTTSPMLTNNRVFNTSIIREDQRAKTPGFQKYHTFHGTTVSPLAATISNLDRPEGNAVLDNNNYNNPTGTAPILTNNEEYDTSSNKEGLRDNIPPTQNYHTFDAATQNPLFTTIPNLIHPQNGGGFNYNNDLTVTSPINKDNGEFSTFYNNENLRDNMPPTQTYRTLNTVTENSVHITIPNLIQPKNNEDLNNDDDIAFTRSSTLTESEGFSGYYSKKDSLDKRDFTPSSINDPFITNTPILSNNEVFHTSINNENLRDNTPALQNYDTFYATTANPLFTTKPDLTRLDNTGTLNTRPPHETWSPHGHEETTIYHPSTSRSDYAKEKEVNSRTQSSMEDNIVAHIESVDSQENHNHEQEDVFVNTNAINGQITQGTDDDLKEKVINDSDVGAINDRTTSSKSGERFHDRESYRDSSSTLPINQTQADNESHLLFSVGAAAGITATIVLIIGIVLFTAKNYKNKKAEMKKKGLEISNGKDAENPGPQVSIYASSVYHAPLPDPPVFQIPVFTAPVNSNKNLRECSGTLETRVICSMHIPNPSSTGLRQNTYSADAFYDHPPSTGSYRAASIPEPPEQLIEITNLDLKDHLYDEIPCWKQSLPLDSTTEETLSYYANTKM